MAVLSWILNYNMQASTVAAPNQGRWWFVGASELVAAPEQPYLIYKRRRRGG